MGDIFISNGATLRNMVKCILLFEVSKLNVASLKSLHAIEVRKKTPFFEFIWYVWPALSSKFDFQV